MMEAVGRRVSLRRRALLLVAATTVVLATGLYFLLQDVLIGSFDGLEQQTARNNVERVRATISHEREALKRLLYDWARWDETYDVLRESASPADLLAYRARNFYPDAVMRDRTELVVIIDRHGAIRLAEAFHAENGRRRRIPNLAQIRSLCPQGTCSERTGFLETSDGPMLVGIHPIVPSNDETAAARGVLIMGRRFDEREITHIAEMVEELRGQARRPSRRALSISAITEGRSSREMARRIRSSANGIVLREISDERIVAYTALSDIDGRPYLLARIEMPRTIYAYGQKSRRSLVVAIVMAGIVFGVVILLLVDRVVLRRVTRLSEDVQHISEDADPALRVEVVGNDELAGLAVGINGMLDDLASAREVIRAAFGRYVSEDVARAILSRPDGAELGGQVRDVTLLFSDIRSYSTVSERMVPADVVEILNEYFAAMSEVIEREGGCVIEFLGDAVLAVFGAPGELPDHAERAVRAALGMQRRADDLNDSWRERGKARFWEAHGIDALRMRIGLHSGSVIVGNMGSKTRMKYAVIGDAVNTAARVEALNETLGTDVLLSEQVRAKLGEELAARTVDRGEHAVKGRSQSVHVYSIARGGASRA